MGQVYGMEELTLSAIAEMDGGRIGEAMKQALKRIAQDMDDRPGDDRPRKINLEIATIPVIGERLQSQLPDGTLLVFGSADIHSIVG